MSAIAMVQASEVGPYPYMYPVPFILSPPSSFAPPPLPHSHPLILTLTTSLQPNLLFIIERSTNNNVVVYNANVSGGVLNEKEPVLGE